MQQKHKHYKVVVVKRLGKNSGMTTINKWTGKKFTETRALKNRREKFVITTVIFTAFLESFKSYNTK